MTYDPYRNLTGVSVGGNPLVTYGYRSGSGRLKSMTYANGAKQELTYDSFGNVKGEKWTKGNTIEAHYRYFYNASNQLTKTLDILNKKVYNINRVGENVVSVEEYDAASVSATTFAATDLTHVGTMHYSFDSDGKQFRKKYVAADGTEQKYVFEFRDEQNVAVQLPTGAVSHAKTDHLGRKVFDEIQLGTGLMNRTFTYHEGKITDAHKAAGKQVSEPTTTLVKEIRFHDGRTIAYEYDAEERITKVTDSADGVTEYTYDALGQLLTETVDGTTVSAMTYDKYGNILTKNSIAYTYGNAKWKDLLTAYNGQAISYDAQGNPTHYLGHTLTWEKGRQLKTFGANSYKYNNDGIRIQKRTATEIHDYILDGTNILKELVTDTGGCPKYTNEYLYDLDGTVCGIKHNNTAYYFYKNLQGDVIAITNANGAVVARYTYDAWGVPTIKEDTSGCNIATVNPFRYRSYYYDSETKFYYLQSRYYNPETGRFISADELLFLGKERTPLNYNAFSYCENNVVNATDSMGYASKKTYSGVVGFGIQISINVNMLCYQGIFGVEAIWFAFTKNNNFNNGLIPWVYNYGGFSVGVNFDITKLLSKSLLDSPKKLLSGIGFGLSCSLGITFFLVTANKMSGPKDYLRDFEFSSVTVWGVTVSRAAGSNITTYGVGFTWEISANFRKGISIGKKLFGTSGGYSFYWAVPIGRTAKELYNTVKKRV